MTPLSSSLRVHTRVVHEAAEGDFEADLAFRDLGAYTATLHSLQGWYPLVERRLEESGQPPGDWQRASLLAQDLTELEGSSPFTSPDVPAVVGLPETLERGEAAGWLYVLVGSALGGRVLARLAVATLGAATPVSFFDSDRRDVGALWRVLSATQDAAAYASSDQGKYTQDAIRGARSAFASFRQTVRWGDGRPRNG